MTDSTASHITGVIVVHGMGHPRPGALLRSVALSIGQCMAELSAYGAREQVELTSDAAPGPSPPLLLQCGNHQWLFAEAHWAPHVTAPPFTSTLYWAAFHFLRHSARLVIDAFAIRLWPALRGLAAITLAFAKSILTLPPLLILFPVAPVALRIASALLMIMYRAAIRQLPESGPGANPMRALARWRDIAPCILAAAVTPLPLLIATFVAAIWPFPTEAWLAIAYACAATYAAAHDVVSRLTVDPWTPEGPITALILAGYGLSHTALLQARQPPLQTQRIYRDLLHNILAGPATAAIAAARNWLLRDREYDLIAFLKWERADESTESRLAVFTCLLTLILFRILASFTWAWIYILGALALFPLSAALWLVSRSATLPALRRLTTCLKQRLEGLVLTSVGDINLILRDPEQAALARRQVESAIDALLPRCTSICIVAHSLGCAVSYDTLVQPDPTGRLKKVRSLITVGGILPMVWRTTPRRPAFDAPLPSHLRWLNLWARFDPAEGGPIPVASIAAAKPYVHPFPDELSRRSRSTVLHTTPFPDGTEDSFEDVTISNEDNIFRDHTSYWQNRHEVVSRITREIWGLGGMEYLDGNEYSDASRAFKRRMIILLLSGPSVAVWNLIPILTLLCNESFWLALAVTGALQSFALCLRQGPSRRALERLASAAVVPIRPATGTFADGKKGTVIGFGLGENLRK